MTAKLEDLPRVPRGKPLIGKDRERFRESVSVVYNSDPDVSIRDISEWTGRSFGFIRTMLIEAGVELRPRGGSTHCDKALET
ncbi:helix-turn-helix domain-containing protein [Streptomyces sp. NPDC127074]|uniref:helix-turn-helix domain-containing protein n=1 Tax=Streptomyces sp. NPDC127074 TaxID=3347130 RepID=UPI003652F1FA